MHRILITLLGLVLMLGQSSSPTGMAGAAATSMGNHSPLPAGLAGSSATAYPSGIAIGSQVESPSVVAIGSVVAGVAAVKGN